MTKHVFVYGTLMAGCGRAMTGDNRVELVGDDSMPGSMFNVGAFPGIKLDGQNQVLGELYEILDDSVIGMLDMIEGYRGPERELGSLYLRRVVQTNNGVETFVYEFNYDVKELQAIPNGDWKTFRGIKNEEI